MRLVRSWAGCSKHQPALCQGLGEDRLVSLVRWIRGLGGVLLRFFGVPVPRLTFWVDTSSASPTGQQVVNHFQDPEEAERLGWGDCFPKGRIPGQRKLIYGFMMVHVEME